MDDLAAVATVLRHAQSLGTLGDRPIDEVIAHAELFVEALAGDGGKESMSTSTAVVDLGSGAGVPGLVIAAARPDLTVTLLDRRRARTDVLERAVRRLGWQDRVRVVAADVDELIREEPGAFGAAVARGFGPPELTLRAGLALVEPTGRVVVSEPPEGDRWDAELLAELGVRRTEVSGPAGRVAVFARR